MGFKELVSTYGYFAVFLGSIAEGETFVVFGGIAAHRGYLNLFLVMAVAFAGGWLGDALYFALGRRHAAALLNRFPTMRPRADKARRMIEKYDSLTIISMRFLYGLRTVGPMVVGMSAVPAARFMVLNALGAILWAVVVTAAGYAFSNVIDALLPQIRRYEEYLLLTVVVCGVLLWIIGRVRRTRAQTRG